MADTEQDIFSSGSAPLERGPGPDPSQPSLSQTPPDQQALSEALARTVETGRQERDTRSRGLPPTIPPATTETPAAGQPGTPDQTRHVPLSELLDTRDRAARAERELAEYKRREDENKRKNEKPLDVELFENPQSVFDRQQQQFESTIANIRLENAFGLASLKHGETWDKAFSAWIDGCKDGQNPSLYFSVVNAPQPGDALVKWWKQEQAVARYGDDPDAYDASLREKLLDDEEFLEMARERLFGGAPAPMNGGGRPAPTNGTGQHARDGNGRFVPRHEVRPPTSLSRLNGASPGREGESIDGSEEAIFDAGRAPRHR